ncbi:lipopolysaccharide biosynthesis protein [Campylobacter blaseri]|nr:oligosaccharide flippase family protein [Campylobacter blaseri]
MTGTTIAQAIPVAISPILTRIYTPEDFGVFAIFVAITSILGSIANGRYELAIMLPKKDEDAINLVALGILITLSISLVFLIIIIVLHGYIVEKLNNQAIGFWLYFVPLSILLIGLWNVLNYFNNRKKYYKDLTKATIIKSIVMAIAQLIIGFLKQGPSGLIGGNIISQFFANTKLFLNITKEKKLLNSVKKPKIIALAKKYRKFVVYGIPSTLSDTGALQLPYLMLPKIFDLSIAGHFAIAKRVISIPAGIISKSISQVFFQTLSSREKNKEDGFALLIQTIKKLTIISFFASLILFISSPYLFTFIFGSNWAVSGKIAQYLALIFFITFIVSPLSISFSVTMELHKIAIWQISYLISTFLFFLFFIFNKIDLELFLLLFTIHEYIFYSAYLYIIINTVKKMDKINKDKNKTCVE